MGARQNAIARVGGLIACLGVLLLAPPARGDGEVAGDPPSLVPQIGHHDHLSCAALSPDGRLVATGSQDHRAILWDVESGRELRSFVGHTLGLRSVRFSPDGKRLVTAGDDGTARVWDLATGEEVARLAEDREIITRAIFTPDGECVLTASTLGVATLWRVSSREIVRTFEGHDGSVVDVALSPDGETAATVAMDRTLRLWDAGSGRLRRELGPLIGTPVSVAFSLDGTRLATGTDVGQILFWDVASGRRGTEMSAAIEDGWTEYGVGTSCFRPGTDDLLALLPEGLVALRAAGRRVDTQVLRPATESPAWGVDISRDGTVLLTWGVDSLQLCHRAEACEAGPAWRSFGVQFQGSTGLLLSRDGRWLVRPESGPSAVWDLSRGRPVRDAAGMVLAMAGDGSRVLVESWAPGITTVLRCEDARTGKAYGSYSWPWPSVTAGILTSDGSSAVVGDIAGTVRAWRFGDEGVAPAAVEHRELGVLGGSITALTATADDRLVLAGAWDGSAALWDAATGERLHALQEGRGGILGVDFDPRGDRMLLVARPDAADAEDPNGVEGTWSVSASIRSVASGEEISRPFSSVRGITCATLSPDGRWVLAGYADGTLELRGAEPGPDERRMHVLGAAPRDLAYAPDSRRVFVALADGSVQVVDVTLGWTYCTFVSGPWYQGWAVWDPEGRFDASRRGPGARYFLSWTFGVSQEPVVPGALWERCHEPNLLARCLGFGDATIRSNPTLSALRRPPGLEAVRTATGALTLRLENRGGGIGRVALLVDGQEQSEDVRAPGLDADAERAEVALAPAAWGGGGAGDLHELALRAYDARGTLYTERAFVVGSEAHADVADPSRPKLIPGHAAWGEALTLSEDGRWASTPDSGGHARIWDCRHGVVIRRLGRGCPHATSAALSPDGRLVAVIEGDPFARQDLKIWDWRASVVVHDARLEHPSGHLRWLDAPLRLSWMEDERDVRGSTAPARTAERIQEFDPGGRPRGVAARYELPPDTEWLAARTGAAGTPQHLLVSLTGLLFLHDPVTGRRESVEQIPDETWRAFLECYSDSSEPLTASARGDLVTFSFPGGEGVVSLGRERHRTVRYGEGPCAVPAPAYDDPTPAAEAPAEEPKRVPLTSDGSTRVAWRVGKTLEVRRLGEEASDFEHVFDAPVDAASFSPSGERLYAVAGGTVTEIDLATGGMRAFGAPGPLYPQFLDAPPASADPKLPPRGTLTLVEDRASGSGPRRWVVWGLREGRPLAEGELGGADPAALSAAAPAPMPLPEAPAAIAEAPPALPEEDEPSIPESAPLGMERVPDDEELLPPGPARRLLSPDARYALHFPAEGGSDLQMRDTARDVALWTLPRSDVVDARFTPTGDHLLTVGGGRVVRWAAADGRAVSSRSSPDPLCTEVKRLTQDGRWVLLVAPSAAEEAFDLPLPPTAASGASVPVLLDLESDEVWTSPAPGGWIADIALDGSTVLVEQATRTVVYDRETRVPRCSIPVVDAELGHDGRVAVAIQPSIDPEVRDLVVFDTERGRPLGRWATDP